MLLVPLEPGARMDSDYSTWATMFTSGAWIGLRPIITRGPRKRIRQARWMALAACRAADRGDIRSRDHVPRIAAACRRSFGMRIMDFGWCGLLRCDWIGREGRATARSALYAVECGFQPILRIGGMYLRVPLPTGEGAAKWRVRGTKNENAWIAAVPLTRPAGAGHPLPLGEGFVQRHFLTWTAQPVPGGELFLLLLQSTHTFHRPRLQPALDAILIDHGDQ